MNNSSLFSADRATHIKIVALSLVASIAIIMVAVAARTPAPDALTARIQAGGPVVKASKTIAVTSGDVNPIR